MARRLNPRSVRIRSALDAGFFVSGKARTERGGSVHKVHDRPSEGRNAARREKDKAKGVFWVIWSSD